MPTTPVFQPDRARSKGTSFQPCSQRTQTNYVSRRGGVEGGVPSGIHRSTAAKMVA